MDGVAQEAAPAAMRAFTGEVPYEAKKDYPALLEVAWRSGEDCILDTGIMRVLNDLPSNCCSRTVNMLVTEQCDQWRDMATASLCQSEYDAWQSCNNDWIADPPEGLEVGCTEEGMAYQAWSGDDIEDPCTELNEALWECMS